MAAFNFVALDKSGRQQKGVLEADSARQVRQNLRDKGWAPLTVEAATEKQSKQSNQLFAPSTPTISAYDLALVTRQMATLVQAGLPIEEVLRAVSQQSEGDNPKVASMMLALRSKVMEGYSLAKSMSEFPRAFPDLYRATVAAGEHSGHLDLVLNRLADYTESRQESRQKIQLALIYPILLLVASISIVSFLLVYIVPDIIKVFINTGQELPALTSALISCSEFVISYGLFMLLTIIAAVMTFKASLKQREFKLKVHHKLLHLPVCAKIARGLNTARFASTLSILSASGVPLVEAMKIAGEVLPNIFLREKIDDATRKVSEGASLKNALEQSGYFPPMMLHMIASGEASGQLDEMLARVAHNQETDLENTAAMMVGLLGPLTLLLMGGVVMLIVLAILLPIFNMNVA